MHLCLFISALHGGGAERVATTLARAWDANPRVSRISVVTCITGGEPSEPLPQGIDLRRLPLCQPSDKLLVAIGRNFHRIRLLRAVMRDLQPDVAIAFMDEMAVLVTLAARGTGIPVITALRTEPANPNLQAIWRQLRVPVYRFLSDAVVVQTRAGLDQASKLFPGARLCTIGNPLPNLPDVRGMDGRERLIASAGRLIPSKGFDLLIEAFAQSRWREDGWRLRIHGEGPDRPRLERRIADLGLQGAVDMPGFAKDVLERLGDAQIFAFASRREGSPNALLEAAAMGCACVSTDCNTGPREILDDGRLGLLVPVDDRPAMTDALNRLMDDAALRAELAGHWHKFRNKHNTTTVAERWIDLAAALAQPAMCL